MSVVPIRIQTLNIFLATRSVLVGGRAVITVADLALFSLLNSQVVRRSGSHRVGLEMVGSWGFLVSC